MPVEHEVGHDRLDQRRALPVGEVARGGERRHQIFRQHRVAEPQRGKQQLTEGAEIDHPAGAVEPLQRRQHPPRRLKLALVIVLDHPDPGRGGPGEQRDAAGERHRHAERVLARRRGVDEAGRTLVGCFGVLRPGGDVESLRVDRHRYDFGLGGVQDVDCRAVARILDPCGVAGVDQNPRGETEPLLRPRGQHDLLRRAAHPARGGEVVGDRAAQLRFALRVAVTPYQPGAARKRPRREPFPSRDEACVDLGVPWLERAGQAARRWCVKAQALAMAR